MCRFAFLTESVLVPKSLDIRSVFCDLWSTLMGSLFCSLHLKLPNNQTLDSLWRKACYHFLIWIRRPNRIFLIFGQKFSEKYIFVTIFVVLIFTSKSKFRWHSLKIQNWLLSSQVTWLVESGLIVWFSWILKGFMWMLFWNVLHIWLML